MEKGAVTVPGFDPVRDTPAFANETVFAYDGTGPAEAAEVEVARPYQRRCFVLCRAVVQFHKFAGFDKEAAAPGKEELRAVLRTISRVPAWRTASGMERIQAPGSGSFRELSLQQTALVQEELGSWLPAYLRIGNWRMALPIPRGGQAKLARETKGAIERGELRALYLTRFHRLNHCVVAHGFIERGGGDIDFLIYDPNLPGKECVLEYDAGGRSFALPRTFYWRGGRVNALAVYISPWH